MFIVASGEYVPERVVDNEYFHRCTDRPIEWFERLTGICTRRRARSDENAGSMAIAATTDLLRRNDGILQGVDLIIGASYTPWDTIGTVAHVLQSHFNVAGARAMYVSTACSSFIDSMEIAAAYFATHRANKALIVAVEHNSLYSSDEDDTSGHLWGDAAAAVVVQASSGQSLLEIVDIFACGLADKGHGPAAVTMVPRRGGLVLAHGREVFTYAVREMAAATRLLLQRNLLDIDDLRLMIPHQANRRIIDSVARELGLTAGRVGLTIGELGNTGCASVAVTFHRNWERLAPGEYAALVTFGGGYSVGAALLRRVGT